VTIRPEPLLETSSAVTPADPHLTLRIGTRGSELALWQANHIKDRLMAAHEGLEVELVVISTEGDRIQDRPLHEVGGKGLFVKAIEARLLDGSVDLAVHSFKDMPAEGPARLTIAATPERADPRDVVVGPAGVRLAELREGARVGTGSLRRGALARRWNPKIELVPIRGNVPTRIRKVDEGGCDVVLLAAAGLSRLGLSDRVAEYLPVDSFCPAPAQGILALQCRADDARTFAWAAVLGDPSTTIAAAAERGFLRRLSASCNVPVGCHAQLEGERVVVRGLVVDPSGEPCYEEVQAGVASEAEAIGISVAETILARGGDVIVAAR
jgi:hydroxymethylbilane synthase